MFHSLFDWGEAWCEIVGREYQDDDPILIPASTGRLSWDSDPFDRWTSPRPLSTAGFYRVFRERGARAGYPSLSATDCTVEGGATALPEEAF